MSDGSNDFTVESVTEQAKRLFPGKGGAFIAKLVKFLMTIAPYLLPLFMARDPEGGPMMRATAPGDGVDDAVACDDLIREFGTIPEPGKMAGPLRQAAIEKAFAAILDLAERNINAAAAALDAAITRFVPFFPNV